MWEYIFLDGLPLCRTRSGNVEALQPATLNTEREKACGPPARLSATRTHTLSLSHTHTLSLSHTHTRTSRRIECFSTRAPPYGEARAVSIAGLSLSHFSGESLEDHSSYSLLAWLRTARGYEGEHNKTF